MYGEKELQTMRCRPRNLTYRRKWPLRLGLFLIYVFVQYVASTKTLSETATFSLSSAQYKEDSTSESTDYSVNVEEIAEATSMVSTVVEKPKKEVFTEEPKEPTEVPKDEASSSREHGTEEALVRDLSQHTTKFPKKGIEVEVPQNHGRETITTLHYVWRFHHCNNYSILVHQERKKNRMMQRYERHCRKILELQCHSTYYMIIYTLAHV